VLLEDCQLVEAKGEMDQDPFSPLKQQEPMLPERAFDCLEFE
jgi:hypothetical protein